MSLFSWGSKPEPEIGQRRLADRFLLLPLTLGGETRWLGVECIRQEYREYRVPMKRACGFYTFQGWRDVEWAE